MTTRELINALRNATDSEKHELGELLFTLPISIASCPTFSTALAGCGDWLTTVSGSPVAIAYPTDEPIVKEAMP